jgi:hypothetical protein
MVPPAAVLTFSETETIVLECRAVRVQKDIRIVWLNPQNGIVIESQRLNVTSYVVNTTSSAQQEVRSVMTLTNASQSDSGVYRCIVANDTELLTSVNICVTNSVDHCGFESDNICGWTTALVSGSLLSWQRRGPHEIIKSDHTYGGTTAVGHFMEVVRKANVTSLPNVDTSSLTSASVDKHDDSKCLGIWFILQGDITLVIQLVVSSPDSRTTTLSTVSSSNMDYATADWQLKQLRIEPQNNPYKIVLQANWTNNHDSPSLLAIDDVSLTSGYCYDVTGVTPTAVSLSQTSAASAAVVVTTGSDFIQPIATPTNAVAQTIRQTPMSTAILSKPSTIDTTASEISTLPTTHYTTTKTSSLSLSDTITTTTTTQVMTTFLSSSAVIALDSPSSTRTSLSSTPGEPSTFPAIVPAIIQTDSTEAATVETQSVDEDGNDDDLSDADSSGSNAGLALGITLAVMAAAACTAAILYRRRRRGKKSTYITFGNPSYSREHLPANDFTLDSPLTLSSNGYTVLA